MLRFCVFAVVAVAICSAQYREESRSNEGSRDRGYGGNSGYSFRIGEDGNRGASSSTSFTRFGSSRQEGKSEGFAAQESNSGGSDRGASSYSSYSGHAVRGSSEGERRQEGQQQYSSGAFAYRSLGQEGLASRGAVSRSSYSGHAVRSGYGGQGERAGYSSQGLGLALYAGHVASQGREEEHYEPAKYQFEYGVEDKHTGDIKRHHEERDGDNTRGFYTLHEPDGTIRTVHYTVDKHSGFNAVVERTGKSAHPEQVSQRGGNRY